MYVLYLNGIKVGTYFISLKQAVKLLDFHNNFLSLKKGLM